MRDRGGTSYFHHLLTGTSYFIPQCLHFLIHKMGMLVNNSSLAGVDRTVK